VSDRCRSCKAEVIWTVTDRGKAMQVDAAPVAGGNIELIESTDGTVPLARYVKAEPEVARHVSHFATCPQAGEWRRR